MLIAGEIETSGRHVSNSPLSAPQPLICLSAAHCPPLHSSPLSSLPSSAKVTRAAFP